MDISPPIAALQADPAEQVHAQHGLTAALASWRESAGVRRVLAGFARYAKGAPLADQRELAGLFGGDEDAARDLVAPLLSGFAKALVQQPLGVVPVRHFTDGVMSVLMLAREGDSLLTLTAIDGAGLAARPEPKSACFSPSDEWEVVLSGTGKARLVERCGERIATHGLDLAPGLSLGRDGAREALIFDAADGVVLLLRLQRRLDSSQPRLEISLEDGKVLHRASATRAKAGTKWPSPCSARWAGAMPPPCWPRLPATYRTAIRCAGRRCVNASVSIPEPASGRSVQLPVRARTALPFPPARCGRNCSKLTPNSPRWNDAPRNRT